MLLLLALLSLGGATYLAGEVATFPKRQQRLSVRRAAQYGHLRTRTAEGERVRFKDRVIAPAVQRLARVTMRLTPKATHDVIGAKLLAAGTKGINATQFLALKSGLAITLLVVTMLRAAAGHPMFFLLAPVLGFVGFLFPDVFLTLKTRSRRESVRAELPDVLDLLAVSVEAGLGFDGAVTKLTEYMDGALVEEFALTLGEIRIGESRQEALKKLVERCPTPELAAFVRSVIQADQLGISLGRILRVQAADSRLRRQAIAEEKAMKAPIKMLFPTVMFIFPAMFLVILGPAFLNLAHTFKL
jgi:tight adherence protein C